MLASLRNRHLNAYFNYADGLRQATVSESSARHFTLREHGVEFVRSDARLRGWLAKEDTDLTQRQFSAQQEHELQHIVEGIIRERDPEGVADCTRAVLSSVIYRNPTEDPSYANTVHRDLDEVAVCNLRTHDGLTRYYNAWIPRARVDTDPLGVLLPNTVDPARDITGFMNMEHDRTGLKYHAQHEWVYVEGLAPGDVLLFRSDKIFHASCAAHDQCAPQRVSLDMRVYFGP